MAKIRGMKVKSDSGAEDAASTDAEVQGDGNHNNSAFYNEPSKAKPPSDVDWPPLANKTVPKTQSKKAPVRDDVKSQSNATAKPSADKLAARQGSKNVGEFGGGDQGSASVASSWSTDKQPPGESLRTCAQCLKQESTLHEFKKCKKYVCFCISLSSLYHNTRNVEFVSVRPI